jgi:ribosomal protein L29
MSAPVSSVKAYALRKETKASLLQKLDDYKQELASLRVAQVSNGAPSKLAKMYPLLIQK